MHFVLCLDHNFAPFKRLLFIVSHVSAKIASVSTNVYKVYTYAFNNKDFSYYYEANYHSWQQCNLYFLCIIYVIILYFRIYITLFLKRTHQQKNNTTHKLFKLYSKSNFFKIYLLHLNVTSREIIETKEVQKI